MLQTLNNNKKAPPFSHLKLCIYILILEPASKTAIMHDKLNEAQFHPKQALSTNNRKPFLVLRGVSPNMKTGGPTLS